MLAGWERSVGRVSMITDIGDLTGDTDEVGLSRFDCCRICY